MKNWLAKFVLACATSSLFAAGKTPILALVNPADAAQWQSWVHGLGWKVVTAPAPPEGKGNIDARVQALAKTVREAEAADADPARVYIAGRGQDAAAVFYAISRTPDLYAAGIALGGSPEAAIDSGRIFAANFTNTPVLWATDGAADEALAAKVKAGGLNLEWRAAAGLPFSAVFEWLTTHTREEFPANIDCETNTPTFASCYWLEPVKFDAAERNDVLPTSRVIGGSGAYLDLGNFGYRPDDPGPGLLVSSLADKYSGPLKIGDRIMALDGKAIENPVQFAATMNQVAEARTAVVMIARGKQRLRTETAIVVPRREGYVTSRVQGRYDARDRQILVISRTVTQMRIQIPGAWLPAGLNWNGVELEKVTQPGCYLLTVDKELLHAAPCT